VALYRREVLMLLHEHVFPLSWRGMIIFAIGLFLVVKLMDYMAGRTVNRVRGRKTPGRSRG
jgi:hypothetical protein